MLKEMAPPVKESGNKESPPTTQPTPACPDCGKSMALRTARKGYFAGKQFWGCSGYPECKGTRPLDAGK
jgi:restriction system protein